jgi:XapX domain-containing protein
MLYGLLNVRSPAPPIVGLIGLLGILVGEQVPALAKRWLAGDASAQAFKETCRHHVLGPSRAEKSRRRRTARREPSQPARSGGRRRGACAVPARPGAGAASRSRSVPADMILRNGRLTTLDRSRPAATALAIAGGLIAAVGSDEEVMRHAGPDTKLIDSRAGA